MEKFSLNGKWQIKSNTYDVVGDVPGSVYSALLACGKMDDPFYRDNERTALTIMDEEFVFTREFEYTKKSDSVLLVCEGIDTRCDLYINDKFVTHTNNMHRTYYIEVAPYLADGKNVIKAVFPPHDAYIKAKTKEKELTSGSGATTIGFAYVRKAFYMSGWDWGPMLPDAGIWKDIYLIDGSIPRITDVRVLQKHDNAKVYLTVKVSTSKRAETKITLISPDGESWELKNNRTIEIQNSRLWWPNGYGKQPLYTVRVEAFEGGMSVFTPFLSSFLDELEMEYLSISASFTFVNENFFLFLKLLYTLLHYYNARRSFFQEFYRIFLHFFTL